MPFSGSSMRRSLGGSGKFKSVRYAKTSSNPSDASDAGTNAQLASHFEVQALPGRMLQKRKILVKPLLSCESCGLQQLDRFYMRENLLEIRLKAIESVAIES